MPSSQTVKLSVELFEYEVLGTVYLCYIHMLSRNLISYRIINQGPTVVVLTMFLIRTSTPNSGLVERVVISLALAITTTGSFGSGQCLRVCLLCILDSHRLRDGDY